LLSKDEKRDLILEARYFLKEKLKDNKQASRKYEEISREVDKAKKKLKETEGKHERYNQTAIEIKRNVLLRRLAELRRYRNKVKMTKQVIIIRLNIRPFSLLKFSLFFQIPKMMMT
jgi:hypothetical protein